MKQLHIRGVDEKTVEILKQRAHARGWTVAKLIEMLVILHSSMQTRAADNLRRNNGKPTNRDRELFLVLQTLGLEAWQV